MIWRTVQDEVKTLNSGPWRFVRLEGDLGGWRDAVSIQGPIPENKVWRVWFYGRWKDAVTKDCDTEDDAKVVAEKLVRNWLSERNLKEAA